MMKAQILIAVGMFLVQAFAEEPPSPSGDGRSLDTPVPSWFLGAWMREWFQEKGKSPDSSVLVRYVQTPVFYGDVRIPSNRAISPNANSINDLTDAELRSLLGQKGFTGSMSLKGRVATWTHDIDFQPPSSEADEGKVEQVQPNLIREHGLDEPYVESWWRLSSGDGKFLGVKITRNDGKSKRVDRMLSLAGDHFVFARNRAKALPLAKSLAELVEQSHATRSEIIQILDCELSFGLVRGGRVPWEITLSTMPWKQGKRLEFADQLVFDSATRKLKPNRIAPGEQWTFVVNTLNPDELKALFPAGSGQSAGSVRSEESGQTQTLPMPRIRLCRNW